MRQLDHPNIIKLIDFSESRQYYYIVLELCPGGELFHQIVRLTYFSEDLSRHVIYQVAKALQYLHEEAGVVHRYVSTRPVHYQQSNSELATSNLRTCYSTPHHSYRQKTQSRRGLKTRTRPMRANSFQVLELVVLESLRSQISASPRSSGIAKP